MSRENEWFRPYESFKFNDMGLNIKLQTVLDEFAEKRLGIRKPKDHHLRERVIPSFKTDDFSIGFDYANVDKEDRNKYRGRKIYYPVRQPNPEEIVSRSDFRFEIGVETVVSGFGEIFCVKDPVKEEEIIRIREKELYPYGLFLRTLSEIFYSIGILIRSEDEEAGRPGVVYSLWRPHDRVGEIGKIYVPVDLSSLRKLEFNFSKLDRNLLCKDSDSFIE